MQNKNRTIIACSAVILLLVVIAIATISVLKEDEKKPHAHNNPDQTVTQAPEVNQGEAQTAKGLITDIDLDRGVIQIMDVPEGTLAEYTYTGGTDIRTSYDKPIPVSSLEAGDFVDFTFDEDMVLRSMKGAEGLWTYKHIRRKDIDRDLEKVTVAGNIYRYSDAMKIICGDRFVSLDTLIDSDYLNIYGFDNYIYLIRVVSGHGDLKLSNASEFVGGVLNVGRDHRYEISDNLVITLPEGEYDVSATYLDLFGEARIRISKGKTAVFDLAEFGAEPVEYGSVSFDISPDGAELFVDGVKTLYYGLEVDIAMGSHDIEVSLGGYNTYSGTLEVSRRGQTRSISLSASVRDEDSLYEDGSEGNVADTGSQEDEASGVSGTEDGNNSESSITDVSDSISDSEIVDITEDTDLSADEDETDEGSSAGEDELAMIICCTDGCAVFVDDVYKGEITDGSLVLDKEPGSHEIRLTKEGYITRRYTVTVEEDFEDAVFRFPDMVRE